MDILYFILGSLAVVLLVGFLNRPFARATKRIGKEKEARGDDEEGRFRSLTVNRDDQLDDVSDEMSDEIDDDENDEDDEDDNEPLDVDIPHKKGYIEPLSAIVAISDDGLLLSEYYSFLRASAGKDSGSKLDGEEQRLLHLMEFEWFFTKEDGIFRYYRSKFGVYAEQVMESLKSLGQSELADFLADIHRYVSDRTVEPDDDKENSFIERYYALSWVGFRLKNVIAADIRRVITSRQKE